MQKTNHEIRFKCTEEEHDKIQKKAEELGLNVKQYVLLSTKGKKVTIIVE